MPGPEGTPLEPTSPDVAPAATNMPVPGEAQMSGLPDLNSLPGTAELERKYEASRAAEDEVLGTGPKNAGSPRFTEQYPEVDGVRVDPTETTKGSPALDAELDNLGFAPVPEGPDNQVPVAEHGQPDMGVPEEQSQPMGPSEVVEAQNLSADMSNNPAGLTAANNPRTAVRLGGPDNVQFPTVSQSPEITAEPAAADQAGLIGGPDNPVPKAG